MISRRLVLKTVLAAIAGFALATAQPSMLHASIWTKISTTTSPAIRTYPAMAYDPVSEKVVLFGGLGINGNLNDTWLFDGTNWTEVATAVAPPVRNGASMAFDVTTRKLVMFGGFDVNQYLQDTWVWDGANSTWTQVPMKSSPPKATGAMLFSDPITGRAMMFGGYNSSQVIPVDSVTWRWTGTSWHRLNPSTVPYPRAWGIAANDPFRRNVVLTGGTGDTIRSDNTWTWDGTNWTLQSPTTQIPAYVGAGSGFDLAMHAVVVFGAFSDTWKWTGTDWVQLNAINPPPSLSGEGMTYDLKTHQTIIFGGQLSNGGLANETAELLGR